jgi:hypothetical protein
MSESGLDARLERLLANAPSEEDLRRLLPDEEEQTREMARLLDEMSREGLLG